MKHFFVSMILLATAAIAYAENDLNINEPLTSDEMAYVQEELKNANCGARNGYKFCVHPGEGERKDEVLYHFHGIMGDETNFLKNRAFIRLQKLWDTDGRGRPHVISISYGIAWILTSKNTRPHSGLLDAWNTTTLKEFESFAGITHVTKRFLVGDSMGGHNVLKLFYRNPEFFDRVLAMCPAQLPISPYVPKEEMFNILPQLQSIWPMFFAAVGLMARHYDDEMWKKESPMYFNDEFLKHTDKLRILLTEHDMYGFTKTNLSWLDEIQKRGKKIEYVIEPGMHCTPKSMVYVNNYLK